MSKIPRLFLNYAIPNDVNMSHPVTNAHDLITQRFSPIRGYEYDIIIVCCFDSLYSVSRNEGQLLFVIILFVYHNIISLTGGTSLIQNVSYIIKTFLFWVLQ